MTDDAISICAPLRPKHERFLDAYLASRNATAAARAAGYSKKSAHACGSSLLRRDLDFTHLTRQQAAALCKLFDR